jgi:Tfp pilus assembly PilM family ATPase
MFKFKSKYPIGIDIGNHNIYAAQLKENEQDLVVRELVQREFEGGDEGILEAKPVVTSLLKKLVNANILSVFPLNFRSARQKLWKKPF